MIFIEDFSKKIVKVCAEGQADISQPTGIQSWKFPLPNLDKKNLR